MSAESFSIKVAGQKRNVWYILCGRCSQFDDVPYSTSREARHGAEERGWHTTSNLAHHDRCPTCLANQDRPPLGATDPTTHTTQEDK